MENASKALIIAGAILLSILLISLGIMVYNNAKGTISDANLDAEQAQAFNTKISQYCGNKKSATDMNSLMDAISASNGAQSKVSAAQRHYIAVTASDSGISSYVSGDTSITINSSNDGLSSTSYPSFDAGISYKATYKTDASGYINQVTITKGT